MQSKHNHALADTLLGVGVVPVLTIDNVEDGVATARALARGGLDVIEVTLRTTVALEAIRRIRVEVPKARVGAGTVLAPEQAAQAIRAGATFIVSPGMTPRLVEAAEGWEVAFLPGAATASEAMALSDLGYTCLKFFPAEAMGGIAALKALAAPLVDIRFCPTGGIDAGNARDYLALPNVVAVGGSWVAPKQVVADAQWQTLTVLAEQACELRRRG